MTKVKKIAINCHSVRPIENILGLIDIFKDFPENKEFFLFIYCSGYDLDLSEDIIRIENIKVIQRKIDYHDIVKKNIDIVIGVPQINKYQKVKCMLRGVRFYTVQPGVITKRMGKFQLKGRHKPYVEFFKSVLNFRQYTICHDQLDFLHVKESYSRVSGHYKVLGLPKIYFLAKQISSASEKKKMLLAPTHGNALTVSELYSDDFIQKLKVFCDEHGLELVVSVHADDRDVVMSKAVKSFSVSDWSSVRHVVTDYSSIAYDFSLAGGTSSFVIDENTEFSIFNLFISTRGASVSDVRNINLHNPIGAGSSSLKAYKNWYNEL